MKDKKYRALKAAYDILDNELSSLESEVRRFRMNYLTIDDARKRDYIVRTNYIGKLTYEALIEDFKQEIEQQLKDTFHSCCNQILNFQLINVCKFREILDTYEKKQIVLDTYKKYIKN